ncbi:asparagine synthase C-terminal domain-containing protein [Luteimonas granuli]|uniref:asparagine synthase (glutamine-hydrolyzing) n=1 Tax=Luteimonas granuli TaxID=1176533 RepID=A0A518N6N6_9GAMM|nr:asparagine synthase C-terminal domain-containing protein [Luteimonas granuli]QDW67581.1 asparagine synthase [Luteimonas granuli]
MGYHYIALVGSDTSGSPPWPDEEQVRSLRGQGMQSVFSAGPAVLFASPETPVLPVPGGVVIGHLFARDGSPAKPDGLPGLASQERFATHLLTEYWGEYLLLQVATGLATGLRILREPSGGVPCLYSFEKAVGFVTSDISLATGLGLARRRVDWSFIAQAVAYPHLQTARTGLSGLQELLPGCSLTWSSGRAEVRDAWLPWAFVREPHRHHDPREAAAEIRTTIASVVRAWAETDRNIMVELSGGLDSSIVAMSLRGTSAEVTCCTMVTPVPGADERPYAREVADALGVELHVETLGFGNARFDFTPPVLTARPRMSVLQFVAHEAVHVAACKHGSTSFFSGGGGDTVFSYLQGPVPAADAFRERGVRAAVTAIQHLSMLHQCTYWKAGWLTLRKLLRGSKIPCKADTSLLAPSFAVPDVHHPWFAVPPEEILPGDQERIADLAGTQVFRESAPRGSTHWLRLPLLSQPVVEACLKAPTWMWIAGGENRALARSAFADLLPRNVLERRSKGTFMNYYGAIYQRNKRQMRDYLLTGHLRERGLLQPIALETFVDTSLPPRDTSFMRVFDLCMIENWIRHQG